MSETLEFPYLAAIPYKIMSDKNLCPNAKLHFGCLAGLSKREGYCWATDEQLAEMHGVQLRQIQRWHKELEDRGHIFRKNENRPYRDENNKLLWKKERKIYVNEGFSNNVFDSDKKDGIDDSDKKDGIDDSDKKDGIKEEISKEEISKRKKAAGRQPPAPSHQRRENIKTTDEEHTKLMNEIGEEMLEACYDRLQEWKEDTPRTKWKRSDYRSIKRWVINAIQEDKQRQAKAQKGVQQENNIDFAKRIAENFNHLEAPRKNIALQATSDYLVIYSTLPTCTKPPTKIFYRDGGFKEQVEAALKNWRLT